MYKVFVQADSISGFSIKMEVSEPKSSCLVITDLGLQNLNNLNITRTIHFFFFFSITFVLYIFLLV